MKRAGDEPDGGNGNPRERGYQFPSLVERFNSMVDALILPVFL
ncbi:MAG: hypothetical protein ACEPOZ_08015 [Marinifilaceae bacterium]